MIEAQHQRLAVASIAATSCVVLGMVFVIAHHTGLTLASPTSRERAFLRHAGLLSLFVGFDDMLLFRERIAPVSLHIPELAVELFWFAAGLHLLLRFPRVLLSREGGWIGLAGLALLSLSSTFDILLPITTNRQFFEDAPKFVGLVTWATFLTMYARATLRPRT
jgi:hypothetical protein